MPSSETITVYCNNYIKNIKTFCEENKIFVVLKLAMHIQATKL
jgi:hypothetical protein